MVVEQEMAEIYPPEAEELSELLPDTDCGDCGYSSCIAFAEAVLGREATPDKCTEISREFAGALASILDLDTSPIPYNIMMEQVPLELIEINGPDRSSPLLITCNFQETVRIMREILTKSGTRAFLLPTLTHGYSVDNAVYEKMFRAVEVFKALTDNAVGDKLDSASMIIPGLAASEKNAIKQMTKWEVEVGPESGFLAPLYIIRRQESL